eukprot:TRINITY_DN7543_c0_g1_i5.p1 TRINITY_DN7543_c0_g1~~TRINITY_DN7543_c0_g1_i5.p1  ORF type:complete len:383 (-),score=82.60 TRINITY_DN7543_c0_g1_i5:70-1116(-)
MTADDFKQASSIVRKVIAQAQKGESHHTYHAFFAAMDYEKAEARTYELTLVRKEHSVVAVLTKKTHELEAEDKYSFYYETYDSAFGLPFKFSSKAAIIDSELSQELVSYMRQYLIRYAEQTRGSNMHMQGQLTGFMDWANSASTAIKSLTEAAQGIINTFKTTKTTTLKEHVKGEGFAAYKAKSNYSRILGVPTSKYDSFLKAFKIQMGLSRATRSKEMDAYFEIAQFASNEWKLNDFIFGVGKSDNTCNNLVITNQINYADDVVHFVSVNVEGSFALAPDTLIYTQHKSVFGGISETTKDVRKSVPRNITADEIKAINALMVLNAMNVYAENMNIKFKLPSDDPWKM